jgi:hypothetical protein
MAVAEIQGLYGAFSFPEKLLQQIWLRGDFDMREPRAADGRVVGIVHPGRWNLLGGPDFKGARLRIGESVTTGDVELHLYAADWHAHGHAADPAYANVVLHVVLFPGGELLTTGVGGREIPILSLLPLLHHDLEEYAADAAAERLANHPLTRAHEALAALSEPALREELTHHAQERWIQKLHYAKIRIARLGWTEACHHAALEILGYRANRAPMLALAAACPLTTWVQRCAGSERDAWLADIFSGAKESGRWSVQGVRPANHPRARLKQYANWAAARSEWPDTLAALAQKLPAFAKELPQATTAALRKRYVFREWRQRFAEDVCGNGMGGSRLDTLICDGLLPLLAARDREHAEALGLWWRHWFVGDVPAKWLALLRGLNVVGTRDWPASHGVAQGLLGWLLAEEKKQGFGNSAEGRGT